MAVRKTTPGDNCQGFTLIELGIVLVILGILASIAIPRFVDLQRSAHLATLNGIEGALHSTASMYQALAVFEGAQTGNLLVNGKNVSFNSGFPEGHWNNAFRYILDVSTRSGYTNANARCTDYSLCGVGNRQSIPTVAGTTGGRGVIIWPEGFRIREQCFAYYYNSHNGSYPLIGVVDTGC